MQCSCIHMYPRYWGKSQSIPKYCIPARKSYAHHLCASLWPYPRVAATPLSLHWMTWMTPRLNGPMPRFCLHQQSMSYQSYHAKRVAFASCIHLALFSYLFWTGAALLTRWERCADDPTGRSTRCRDVQGTPRRIHTLDTLAALANWEFHELPWILKA